MGYASKILCIHQGVELYGSDRSFLSSVNALNEPDADLTVILPGDGELASELRKFDDIKLVFYSKGILRKREMHNPLSFLWNLLAGFLFYLRLFKKYPVIYINTVVMFSALLAAVFYRFSSKRFICHVREIPTGWQLKCFRVLLRASGAQLIFNSEATKAAFGLAGNVIYNGVGEVSQCQDVIKESREREHDTINILLIGRINEWKGQLFLVQALATLTPDILKRVSVRIVGSPFEGYEYLLDDLKRKIDQAGLSDIVSMSSFCADPSSHYRWADYVVVPSTQPEPFGRVAIEAFSYGKPVVAAGHGGLVEIVEDGVSGFLFEPGEVASLASRIRELLKLSNDHYSELSHFAYQRFREDFSIQSYQASLRSVFKC